MVQHPAFSPAIINIRLSALTIPNYSNHPNSQPHTPARLTTPKARDDHYTQLFSGRAELGALSTSETLYTAAATPGKLSASLEPARAFAANCPRGSRAEI